MICLVVKGVVDLEIKVGKTTITMKRVVVVGIPLNVISTYALWKLVGRQSLAMLRRVDCF